MYKRSDKSRNGQKDKMVMICNLSKEAKAEDLFGMEENEVLEYNSKQNMYQIHCETAEKACRFRWMQGLSFFDSNIAVIIEEDEEEKYKDQTQIESQEQEEKKADNNDYDDNDDEGKDNNNDNE
ncbi:PSP proline-rich domain-containing protein [Reticulomyxa filosa]|uniref:PSP proline-rich domain-containing protein n=1 Tax=Reticulomyxa filosa TaxID=46433 RepID=X6LNE9_RETFI|nr:PSP proline-rich domain-containing protein [Reticulomyxa filosa]|eukprot:ETO02871.1 PSP proline-rich domain-containing protein [Reticulomyxa filosa]